MTNLNTLSIAANIVEDVELHYSPFNDNTTSHTVELYLTDHFPDFTDREFSEVLQYVKLYLDNATEA